MAYNPFDKSIHEIKAVDLDILVRNSVAEGYWVEYKSEFQSGEKIAKSISSFANTYGGWYFIGVEADKTNNMATRISGFNLIDIPDPISKLREIVKSNVDPIPVFYSRLVEICAGKVVLVVEVPNNQETPFITRSGRIYRRVSDSSDPVPETSRYAVDRLVDNGRELAQQFEEFCRDDRTFTQSEEQQTWIHIFISPYPLGIISKSDMLSAKGIEDLLQLSQTPLKISVSDREIGSGNVPFTSGQLGVGSVILKQVEPARIAFNSLTVELFMNGRAKFHIPVTYLPIVNREINFKSSEVQRALERILQSDSEHGLLYLRFFDIYKLWAAVTNLSNLYQAWYGGEVQELNLRMVITMENIWRCVPYCDMDEWGNYVQKFGLPAQNVDFIRIPQAKKDSMHVTTPLWVTACTSIGVGFGLPADLYMSMAFRPNS